MTIHERANLTAFVPQGENRRETARALVELADKHGIDQTSIQSANRGFNITDELADLLYEETDEMAYDEPDTDTPDEAPAETAPTKKRK